MQIQPSDEVLEQFGVRLLAPLGGNRNLHWLVAWGDERLVLRRWWQPPDEIDYELRLLKALAHMGWPVAPAVEGPLELEGYVWSLAPLLPGEPRFDRNSLAEQRKRGRLLAMFHTELANLQGFGQRGNWRRCEQILADPTLDDTLRAHEHARPDDIRMFRWHLERARERAAQLSLHDRPGIVIHGDFTPWNLLFRDGMLSGILDFEIAHWDHRVADFALAWRGKYDDVIHAYNEVAPLDSEEWAMLTPMWWAHLIEGVCYDMRRGIADDGWAAKQLLRRSPLMGPDAVEFQQAV